MLTDQDIEKLAAVFTSRSDIQDLKEEVMAIKEIVQGHSVVLDGLARSFDKLDTEYLSMKSQANRHEKWHHQTADKVGIALEA